MAIITMRVHGVSAILMHNPLAMRKGGAMERGGKKIPEPYDEALASLYALPDKQLYIKSDAFREAGLIAASDIRDPTRKGRTTMTRRFAASVFLSMEYCKLERPGGKPITSAKEDWEIDTRRAVVVKQGILRSRAKITNWECDLEFEYDSDTIEPYLISEIMNQSGKYPGVLDYRVGKKGPFGRYTVTNGEDHAETPARKTRR